MRAIPLPLLAFFGILLAHACIEDNNDMMSDEMLDFDLEEMERGLTGKHEFIDRQLTTIQRVAMDENLMRAEMDKLIWTLDGKRDWANLDSEIAYRTSITLGRAFMENHGIGSNAEGYFGYIWFELPPYRKQVHTYKLQKTKKGSLTNYTITYWHHIRDRDIPDFPKLNETVGCNLHCVMDYIFKKTNELPKIPGYM